MLGYATCVQYHYGGGFKLPTPFKREASWKEDLNDRIRQTKNYMTENRKSRKTICSKCLNPAN